MSNYEGTGADFLEYPTIARGAITEVFSPRGIGKTLWAYAVAIKLARRGYRVLLLDRDNPPKVIHERLRGWGADTLLDIGLFKVMTRDTAPPLTEKEKWKTFPIQDYDLVIIDALDATAEGIGEKESSKPSKAFAPLLDIARQKDGPAFLILGNTVRSAKHSRGSGVIEDRADICLEVRDATGFKPKGRKSLVQELLEFAPAGAEYWAEQSERRKGQKVYRLVFVPSKFRVGEQPDLFFIELDLRTEPWTMSDVTKDVIKAGEVALAEAELQRQAQLNEAADALAKEVQAWGGTGEPMLATRDAEPFLMRGHGLKRKEARQLIQDRLGQLWRVESLKAPGSPKALLPVEEPGESVSSAAERT